MVEDDKQHSSGAEEDGQSVEIVVGNHVGRGNALRQWCWEMCSNEVEGSHVRRIRGFNEEAGLF